MILLVGAVPVHVSWEGVILGTTYVATIASILIWMLRIPEAGGSAQKVARAVRESSAFARILVPVQGTSLSDKMVALACQMARYRHAEISLIYVIEVPLTLPSDASMLADEKLSDDVFKRAEAIAERFGVVMRSQIYKTRQAGPGIVQYIRQGRFDVVLMGDVPRRTRGGTEYARTVEYVHEHSPSEVLIYRPAPEELN